MTYKVGTFIKNKKGDIILITKVTEKGYEWTKEGLNYSVSSLESNYKDPYLVNGWSVYVPERPVLKAENIKLIRLALQISRLENRALIDIVSKGTDKESNRRVKEWIKKDAKTLLLYEKDYSGYLQKYMDLINKYE